MNRLRLYRLLFLVVVNAPSTGKHISHDFSSSQLASQPCIAVLFLMPVKILEMLLRRSHDRDHSLILSRFSIPFNPIYLN